MSSDKQIQEILTLQDVELANAMNALKGDPSKLSSFISARKGELYNTVTREHSDSFQKVYGDYIRAGEGTKNILYYHVRNKDLDNLQKSLFDRAKGEADAAMFDSQNAKRQFEINEWTANNKSDTLFFLQLLFIMFTITTPMIYLRRAQFIPSSVFYGIMSLLGIALVLTLVVRIQYTTQSRDQRYWNRRRFAQMGGPPTPPTCEAVQAAMTNTYNTISSLQNSAPAALEGAVNSLQSRVTNATNALMGN